MTTINKFAIAFLASSLPLYALDANHGKELYNSSDCYRCHTPNEFKSENRKAKNYKQLFQNVEACRYSTGADWFDDERDDVVHYLNKKFYKFDIKKK